MPGIMSRRFIATQAKAIQAEADKLHQEIEGAIPTHLKVASCHRTLEAEKKVFEPRGAGKRRSKGAGGASKREPPRQGGFAGGGP